MQRPGIETGTDLKAKSLGLLQHNFGKSGAWYYRIARGLDERPVEPDRPRKSVGAEDTFAIDIFDLEAAHAELTPLIAKVWRSCEANSIRGRTVTLKVKYADFQQITRSRSLSSGIGALADFATISETLLAPVFPTSKGICLLGVTISNFGEINSRDAGQLSLSTSDGACCRRGHAISPPSPRSSIESSSTSALRATRRNVDSDLSAAFETGKFSDAERAARAELRTLKANSDIISSHPFA